MAKEIARVKAAKAAGALGNARVSREDILRMGEALELGLPITKVAALVGKSSPSVRRYIDGEGRSGEDLPRVPFYPVLRPQPVRTAPIITTNRVMP